MEVQFYIAVSQSTRSGDRCKKMSRGINAIEKTFTLHNPFLSITGLCLEIFFYSMLHYLLKPFSRGFFGRRHPTNVRSLQWLQDRGIS